MNRLDIEECNDIHKLRGVCIEQYRTLFNISETCIDVSKWHISSDKGIKQIRVYLIDNDRKVSEILNHDSDNVLMKIRKRISDLYNTDVTYNNGDYNTMDTSTLDKVLEYIDESIKQIEGNDTE